jgi:hypothetical protein
VPQDTASHACLATPVLTPTRFIADRFSVECVAAYYGPKPNMVQLQNKLCAPVLHL